MSLAAHCCSLMCCTSATFSSIRCLIHCVPHWGQPSRGGQHHLQAVRAMRGTCHAAWGGGGPGHSNNPEGHTSARTKSSNALDRRQHCLAAHTLGTGCWTQQKLLSKITLTHNTCTHVLPVLYWWCLLHNTAAVEPYVACFTPCSRGSGKAPVLTGVGVTHGLTASHTNLQSLSPHSLTQLALKPTPRQGDACHTSMVRSTVVPLPCKKGLSNTILILRHAAISHHHTRHKMHSFGLPN